MMIETGAKSAIELQEYNGKYSLVEKWKGRDGVWQIQFCTLKIGQEEKRRPKGIYLGDKDNAIDIITKVLAGLDTPF